MRGLMKIQAGALQFVLFIGAVVAVLLFSFVLITHIHHFFDQKTEAQMVVIKSAENKLLKQLNTPTALATPSDSLGIEVVLETQPWGVFEILKSEAKKDKFKFSKLGMVANGIAEPFALWLKDNKRPLVIAGTTEIEGTSYLPERGVKRGNIGGNGFYGSKLINGEIRPSEEELPSLEKEVLQHLQDLQSLKVEKGKPEAFKKGMKLRHSFKESTKFIYGDNIQLEQEELVGNIIIHAEGAITVEPTAHLRDVILIAPVVEIRSGVQGNFQVLASDRILVEDKVQLNYPSALVVLDKQNEVNRKDSDAKIILGSGSVLRGVLLYHDKKEEERHKAHVHIHQEATVLGQVYCTQNTELKGEVWGSLVTGGFMAMENGNRYQNHLYQGKIYPNKLPNSFGGLSLLNSNQKQLAKWMY